MANIAEVSDSTFENDVLQSLQPVLLEFWALRCEPCRAVAPVVREIASNYEGRLKVGKMDVDKNVQTPARYGVRGVPAILLFKNGKVADQIVGYVSKARLDQMVNTVLV